MPGRASWRAVLRSNVIARNITSGFSPCTSGGGIWMVNFSQATIVNNLVVGNAAGCGGGFYWGGSTGVQRHSRTSGMSSPRRQI